MRSFCEELDDFKGAKPIERLVCNAATFHPGKDAEWTSDGHERTAQVNFLSHFLMVSLLMPEMAGAADPRVVLVGSEGGNEKTALAQAENAVGGGTLGDLKDLKGLKAGFEEPIAMMDGFGFDGAKAYKDSKLALMMLSNVLHAKYQKQTGIAFSSIYPGCVADSPLFTDANPAAAYSPYEKAVLNAALTAKTLQDDDPSFLRDTVERDDAGQRLFQVLHDPRCVKSGVFWSWRDAATASEESEEGSWQRIFENDQSDRVTHPELGVSLFKHAAAVTGAEWPKANQVVSPCPTLKVIGAVSKGMTEREELKRMREMPGFEGSEDLDKAAVKAKLAADAAAGSFVKNTVGRALGFVLRRLLGAKPEAAIQGSYQEEEELDAQLAAKLLGREVEGSSDSDEKEWAALESAVEGSLAAEAAQEKTKKLVL